MALSILMFIATLLLLWWLVTNIFFPPPPPPPPGPSTPALPGAPVSIDGAASKGAPDSRVALIIYSDFECPFCGRLANDVLPAIEKTHVDTGHVRLVFRHLPIESLHANAVSAAEAAECAGQQARFWPMHDLLFQNSRDLGAATVERYGRELGLEMGRFTACLAGEMREKVMSDLQHTRDLGLRTTPTLHIGLVEEDGKVRVVEQMIGAPTADALSRLLDDVVGRSRK